MTRDGGVSEDLELVDQDNFETWLETSALVNFLRDDLGESLGIVESQVREAFGSVSPLTMAPERLATSFESWADDQGISKEAIRIGLKAARQALPRELGGYYRDLSRALEEAGIAPVDMVTTRQRIMRASRNAAAVAVERKRLKRQGGKDGGEGAAAASLAAGSASDQDELTSADAADLLMSLSPDALRMHGPVDTGRSLKEQALALLSEQRPEIRNKPLSTYLSERIEAADRMLSHISRNAAASPRLQEWVNRLSFRVLTAAVADPHFFRPPGHPLLQLLDRLDHLDTFFGVDNGTGMSAELGKIDALVSQSLTIDARDSAAYAPVLDQVDRLVTGYGERLRHDAARAIANLEGRDRRRQAHHYVQGELQRRFGNARMHRVILDLINQAWATLLELRYLREGEGGEQLERAWALLNQINAACSEEGAAGFVDGHGLPNLEAELVDGLAYVGFDPYMAKSMANRVREAVQNKLSGRLVADDYEVFKPAVEVEDAARLLNEIDPQALDELRHQVEVMQPGSLIRARDNDQERLYRLVWCNSDRSDFAFLDTRGEQIKPVTREKLMADLHRGSLRIQAPRHGVIGDRSLDATLHEMQEHIRYHETRDSLTGLHTHQQFTGTLAELLRSRDKLQHLLGFLDIDHFEAISSTCGYKAAEHLLRTIAELMQQRMSSEAFLAFLGGRRFGFVLPAEDVNAARSLCEQLCRDVYALSFDWHGKTYPVSGSLGVVTVRPGEGDLDNLLSSAEIACVTAQEAGGNRMTEFSEHDESIALKRERLRWLSMTEDVIKAERIRLRVQMIAPTDPHSDLHMHHEVLMRAFDERDDELDLGRFIATAEAFNLMADVDRLVIRKALGWAAENPILLSQLGGVAINLSGVSLADPQLLNYIRNQLSHFAVSAEAVSFEVTETAAIASLERAAGIVGGLKDIGCKVALDDFGAGMSSYSYLKSMPVDFVKIDGSFVKDLLTNPHDLAIVKSINEIAHFMGIRTIAEYAESQDIIDRLREIGVDFVQGYAVRSPVLLDDLMPQD